MARKKKRGTEEAGFTGEASPERPRLTPVEVQQKVFRIAFRGYNERDVDEFLDHITEDLAALHEENKRLREQVGDPSAHGGIEAAQRQAEQIVRQAREHAARLLEDSERGGGGGPLPTSFLLGERAFLQRLAQSVQEHARWLKQEARRTQAAGPPEPRNPEPEPGNPKPEPEPQPEPPAATEAPAAEPEPGPPAQRAAAAPVDEPTAAWGPPQEGMGEPAAGWAQEPTTGDADPLLSAWENAFADSGSQPPGGDAPPAADQPQEGEPSLRELFWGEE